MKSQKKLLIAGQNGIIGSYITKELDHSFHIEGIGIGQSEYNQFHEVDLTSKRKVDEFVRISEKYDYVIFLTGLAHAKGKKADYPVFEKINFITLFNLLECLNRYGKLPSKIIFASTISVYGEKYSKSIYSEKDELSPNSPYAKTKIIAEKYLTENYKDHAWILRFAPVYSDKFLLNIERRSKFKGKFYKVGDGKKKLSLLNIKNISHVINEIIHDKVPSGIYNVADLREYSYNDLLEFSKTNSYLKIPRFSIHSVRVIGNLIKNNFIKENSTKLLSDNIYPANKLNQYIDLPYSIDN